MFITNTSLVIDTIVRNRCFHSGARSDPVRVHRLMVLRCSFSGSGDLRSRLAEQAGLSGMAVTRTIREARARPGRAAPSGRSSGPDPMAGTDAPLQGTAFLALDTRLYSPRLDIELLLEHGGGVIRTAI
jgi:hypothetical protein